MIRQDIIAQETYTRVSHEPKSTTILLWKQLRPNSNSRVPQATVRVGHERSADVEAPVPLFQIVVVPSWHTNPETLRNDMQPGRGVNRIAVHGSVTAAVF